MSDKRSRHGGVAKSERSEATSHRTRSETAASTASSSLSEARRRAALSQLQAQQGQRAAAAKAELARRQAEAQAEQARAQAALEAQELKDEAERRQLELELLEQEERGSRPAGYAASSARDLAVAAAELPVRSREPLQTDISSERTREWLAQSQLHVRPVDTAPFDISSAPAPRLYHLSSAEAAAPRLPRITLEKFGGSALEWPR